MCKLRQMVARVERGQYGGGKWGGNTPLPLLKYTLAPPNSSLSKENVERQYCRSYGAVGFKR
jgi:hypothetical protein